MCPHFFLDPVSVLGGDEVCLQEGESIFVIIPILTTRVRGRSSDWVIVRMCVEGTEVESNLI